MKLNDYLISSLHNLFGETYGMLLIFEKKSKEQIGRQLETACPYILEKRDFGRYWEGADINSNLPNDTLDTFLKIMSKPLIEPPIRGLDMFNSKASKPSQTLKDDTLDTLNEKDLSDFSDSGILEAGDLDG